MLIVVTKEKEEEEEEEEEEERRRKVYSRLTQWTRRTPSATALPRCRRRRGSLRDGAGWPLMTLI